MGGSSSRPPPKPVPPELQLPCKKCGRIFTTPAGFARHKDSKSCADAVLWQQQQANGGGGDGSGSGTETEKEDKEEKEEVTEPKRQRTKEPKAVATTASSKNESKPDNKASSSSSSSSSSAGEKPAPPSPKPRSRKPSDKDNKAKDNKAKDKGEKRSRAEMELEEKLLAQPDVFVVEKLLAERMHGSGKSRRRQYLVAWEGYGREEDTWEDADSILDVSDACHMRTASPLCAYCSPLLSRVVLHVVPPASGVRPFVCPCLCSLRTI
jgi:hypothetical protein